MVCLHNSENGPKKMKKNDNIMTTRKYLRQCTYTSRWEMWELILAARPVISSLTTGM